MGGGLISTRRTQSSPARDTLKSPLQKKFCRGFFIWSHDLNKRFLSIDELAQAAKRGEDVSEIGVRKQYVAEIKAVEAAPRTYECTISTAQVDRENDTVAIAGWQLEEYSKNPVVLFAHQYSQPPVGRSVRTWVEGDALKSTLEFVPAGVYEFADTIEALYRLGFMRALSVGFRALKYAMNEQRRGYDILECELLEYSCVPVPANPGALAAAKSAGVNLSPMKAMLEASMEDIDGPGLWVPKHIAIEAMKIASGNPKSITVPDIATPPPTPDPVPAGFQPTAKHFQAALTAAIETAVDAQINHALGRVD